MRLYITKKIAVICMVKREKEQKRRFRKELNAYAQIGVTLWLDGSPSTPREIEKAHRAAEQHTYMRDYVADSQGRLIRLEFETVKEK